jgi:hypothetical protein
VPATRTSTSKGATMATMIIRTYEWFEIVWERGSRWTNYRTAAEAQAVIDGSGAAGTVERHTFERTIAPEDLRMYNPGIADR